MTDEQAVLPPDTNIMREKRFGGQFQPDMSRCRCSVSFKVGRGYDRKQCAKPVKVTRMVGGPNGPEPIGYCSTHDPIKIAERDQKRRERWKVEADQRRQRYDFEAYVERSQPAYYRALVDIAEGANDARALAIAALEQFGRWPAKGIEAASADETRSGSAEGESPVRDSAFAHTQPESH